MILHSDHHHFELHKILHDKMNKLYLFSAMMMFVKSLIGIFVPVYLYKLGFSFDMILLYSFIISATYLLLIPLTTEVINKFGFKNTILISIPIYFLHILSINFVETSSYFFLLSALSFGIYVSFFWPAMHSEIALQGSRKHRGSQMGTLQIITTIFATIAPFIGGIILETKGYFILLIFASFMIVLGSIPLLLLEDIRLQKFHFKYGDYIKLLKSKKYSSSKLAFSAEGIESSLSFTIWPILLFILLNNNFANLGSLFTALSIISVLFIIYFKSYLDKKPKNQVLSVITKLLSTNWFLRSLLLTLGGVFIYIIESFAKLVISVFQLSFVSIFYNNAKNLNYLEYIIFRELYLHGTKMIFLIFLIIVFRFYQPTLQVFSFVLISGIIASFGLNYLHEVKR